MYIILARQQQQNPNNFQCLHFGVELEAVFKYYKYQQCQQQLQADFPGTSSRFLGGRPCRARKTNNSSQTSA